MLFMWDFLVVALYFVSIISIGLYAGRKQTGLEDYALGGRSLPWWAILASIIAAEISAATFLGTPGEGFVLRNFAYAQLCIGAVLGRIIVGKLFLKPYYDYKVVSIYEYLQKRFGITTRRWASVTFLISRVLASGVRLYFAGILLVIAYMFIVGQDTAAPMETVLIYIGALTLITVLTAIYTTLGGLKAVVWTDVLQASILIIAVGTTILLLFFTIKGDASYAEAWHTVVSTVADTSNNPCGVENLQPGKVFDLGITGEGFAADVRNILSSEYTLWTAFLGATFLAMATHGTDQDMVQRMLAAKDSKTGTRAVMLSGLVDIPVVLIFLVCGMLVFVYYSKVGMELPMNAEGEIEQMKVFPYFIIHHLPVGIRGLLVAALLATAMGSLSTALNALATTATRDWYRDVFNPAATEQQLLRAVRWLTVAFAALLIAVGAVSAWYVVMNPGARILPIALGIFGYTYGSLLGVFLLGMLTRTRGNDTGNVLAMLAGFATVVTLELLGSQDIITHISFPWRVTIGTIVTFCVGCCFRTPQHCVDNRVRD
ncbi:MAG: sodium:solute symporter [Akkermansia sp.]|nr:sodium:solute symporter [Akkermansia sp.]